MSIEAEGNSCPYCSTKLQYYYISLTEKMLICKKKECLFPFDMDDISPYVIKVDPDDLDDIAGSSSSPNPLDDELLNSTQSESTSTMQSKNVYSDMSTTESLASQDKSNGISTQSKSKTSNSSNSESLSSILELSNNVSANSKSFAGLFTESLDPLNEVASNLVKSSNDTITLKTLGITLKVDPTNKNKSRSESSQSNGLSTNSTDSTGNKNDPSISASDFVDMDFTQLLGMNDFPILTAEGSGNGLLDVNAAVANAMDMDANAINTSSMDMDANAINSNAMDVDANAINTNVTDGNAMDVNANTITANANTNVTDGNAMDVNVNTITANAIDVNAIDVNSITANEINVNAITVNTTGAVDANLTNDNATNILTVEEYSKMLFGQSDIDINLDDLLLNPNTTGLSMQDNDSMDIDELLGTFDSLESGTLNKTSGNDMDLDIESLMANLNGSFAEAGIPTPNGMSGNHLDVDLDSILANTDDNFLDLINSQNNILNGHFDIYTEMINGNNNGTLDLTLDSVKGQNGYFHENFEKTKNGVVEDEGKEVMEKMTNEDSIKITEDKKGD